MIHNSYNTCLILTKLRTPGEKSHIIGVMPTIFKNYLLDQKPIKTNKIIIKNIYELENTHGLLNSLWFQ